MGDNPFVLCKLDRFYVTEYDEFGGVAVPESERKNYTFDISDTIRVIDGSLYRAVPNGLELITYCENPDDSTARVADGTVRISAYAFAGTAVKNAILPYTLEAIGHKAFYLCENLTIVNFSSYYAPILEEEYDFYYFYSGENLPIRDDLINSDRFGDDHVLYDGLGIVDYFVWNVNSDPTSSFFGANFKDYVGKVENKAVMVKPVNGVGYDSFILTHYFDVVIEGGAAADDTTLAAIDAINRLPDKVALSDKAAVEAARALYNKIATFEQRALVANYQKLNDAEKRISDLEYLANNNGGEEDATPEPEAQEIDGIIVLLIVTAVIAVGCGVGVLVYFLIKKKRGGEPTDPNGFDEIDDTVEESTKELATEEIPAEVITEAEDISSSTIETSSDEGDTVIALDETETTNSDENSEDKEN